jgi:hypothetical protein
MTMNGGTTRKTSLLASMLAMGALWTAPGCDGQTDTDQGAATSVTSDENNALAGTVPAASATPTEKASDYFEKEATSSDPWLQYQGNYMCVLSKVQGWFADDFDPGQVIADWADNDYWRIYWTSGRNTGSGICTNWNNFLLPSGGSISYSRGASAEVSGYADGTSTATSWAGDAITFVRGVFGEMQGNTEYAQINQAMTISGKSTLEVRSEEGNFLDYTIMRGYSHAIRVGVPGAHLAYMIGYNTSNSSWVRATANSWSAMTEFPVSTVSGFSGYWLAGVDQGVCGFTRIAGNFDGGGEWVRIYQNGGQWFIKAQAAAGKGVYGKARCLAYDQR